MWPCAVMGFLGSKVRGGPNGSSFPIAVVTYKKSHERARMLSLRASRGCISAHTNDGSPQAGREDLILEPNGLIP